MIQLIFRYAAHLVIMIYDLLTSFLR
jgi:hypothetical protein